MMTTSAATTLDLYQWTVAEYHRLVEAGVLDEDTPVELINGQIIRMSPVGGLHAACVDKLDELFRDKLKKSVNVRVQSPISLNDLSEPEPDLVILKRRKDFYATGHPGPADVLLLVEVADSTLEKDRQVKAPVYAAAGIPEFWIINIADQQVEQHLQPENDEYKLVRIYKSGQVVDSQVTGPLPVDDLLPQMPEGED